MKKILALLCVLFNIIILYGQSLEEIVTLYNKGEFEKAYEQSSQFITKNPDNLDVLNIQGRILVDMGRYEEGNDFLEKAIEGDRDKTWISAWSHGYLGLSYFKLSRYDESKKELEKCLKLNATKNANKFAKELILSFGFDDYYSSWDIKETEHIRFHIQTPSEITDIPEFTQQREDVFCNISKQLGVKLPKKIDFFVWNNSEEFKTKFGRNLGFASPEYACVYSQKSQTKGHEITHVITHYTGKTKIKTDLINEGTAVYFNQSNENKLETAKQAMLRNNIDQISIKDYWDDWEGQNKDIGYPIAGAFVSEFVTKYGIDGLKKILMDQTYENAKKIFGNELDDLISNFESQVNVKQSSLDTTLNDFITKIILEGYKKGQMTLSPLVLIDGEQINLAEVQVMMLMQDQVKSISILQGDVAIPVFGKNAVNGVLVVETKTGYKKMF